MSESLSMFGAGGQNTQEMRFRRAQPRRYSLDTTSSLSQFLFIRTVEKQVCAKVNSLDRIYHTKYFEKRKRTMLVPRDIHNQNRKLHYCMARRLVWFILFYHPIMKNISPRSIGKQYGRDRKTILHSINKIKDQISDRPKCREAEILRELIAGLNEYFVGYDFDIDELEYST